MLNWIEDAHRILDSLRGSFLQHEENLVLLEFCTGKGYTNATIADMRAWVDTFKLVYEQYNSEDDKTQIIQDIVNLYSYIKNARRVL